ncbi:choice-of-anchor D domain-containing protein [bacterium]|nr:choice-of-anchor D domain-containing protein [bacterium]
MRSLRSSNGISAPRRDIGEPGELIAQFNGINGANQYCSMLGWDPEAEVMWASCYNSGIVAAYSHDANYENFEEVVRVNPGSCMDGGVYDGLCWIGSWAPSTLNRYDIDGNMVGSIQFPTTVYGLAFDQENELCFHMTSEGNQPIRVYEMDGLNLGDQIGVIDNHYPYHGNTIEYGLEWVPEHGEAPLWMFEYTNSMLYQIGVDQENWQCFDYEDAVSFTINNNASLGAAYGAVGHDGEYIWAAGYAPSNIRIYEDGVAEFHWLALYEGNLDEQENPDEWVEFDDLYEIEADGELLVTARLEAAEMEHGEYQAVIHILTNDPSEGKDHIEIPVTLTIADAQDIDVIWLADYGYPDELNWNSAFDEVLTGEAYDIRIRIHNHCRDNADLNIESIAIDDEAFSVDESEFAVAAGDYQDVTVTFEVAADDGGEYENTLTITSDDPDEGVVEIPLYVHAYYYHNLVADPEAIDEELFTGQIMEIAVNLLNEGQSDRNFNISHEIITEPGRDNSSRSLRSIGGAERANRDDAGDQLRTINVQYTNSSGAAYIGDNVMWICSYGSSRLYSVNLENGQTINNIALGYRPLGMSFDGELLWVCQYSSGPIYLYDLNGNQVTSLNPGFNCYGIGSDQDEYMYLNNRSSNIISVFSIEDRQQVRTFEYRAAMANADIWNITWVNEHPDGELWGMSGYRAYQADVDNWEASAVQNFAISSQYQYCGIAHDGENLWVGDWNNTNWYCYDDGVEEVYWLSYEPKEGSLAGDEALDITVTLNATGLDEGMYEAIIYITPDHPDILTLEIPVTMEMTASSDILITWVDEVGYPDVIDWNSASAYGDQVFTGGSYDMTITVFNNGVLPLNVNEISSDLEIIALDPATIHGLEPDEDIQVTVTLAAEEPDEYEGSITFFSNSEIHPEVTVNLHALALDPPGMDAHPVDVSTELGYGDTEDHIVVIDNNGGADLIWDSDVEIISEPDRDRTFERSLRSARMTSAPRRDDLGDVIAQFSVANHAGSQYKSGIAYNPDNELMYLGSYSSNRIDAVSFNEDYSEVTTEFGWQPGAVMGAGWLNGVLYTVIWSNNAVYKYDTNGQYLGSINVPTRPTALTTSQENEWLMIIGDQAGYDLFICNESGQQLGRVDISIDDIPATSRSCCWVDDHRDQQLWVNTSNHIWNLAIDTDNWQASKVQDWSFDNGNDVWSGIGHDGNNLWLGPYSNANHVIVDDAIAEIRWLTWEPSEGEVSPNDSTDVILTFDAGDYPAGEYTAELTITSNDPENGEVVVNITMTIDEFRRLVHDPEELSFGETLVDESTYLVLTIGNDGNADLTVSAMDIEGEYFSIDFENEFTLAPEEQQQFTATFAPEGSDVYRGTLIITSDDSQNEETEIAMVGWSRERAPNIYVVPMTLDFEEIFVGTEKDLDFRIGNDGDGPLQVVDITANADYVTTDFAGEFVVEAGNSIDMVASFAPESAGEIEGNITITSIYAEEGDEYIVEVIGAGLIPPDILIEPDAVSDELAYGEESDHNLTIYNDGGTELIWESEVEITQEPERDFTDSRQLRGLMSVGPERNVIEIPSDALQIAVKNRTATPAQLMDWKNYLADLTGNADNPRRDRRSDPDEAGYEWRDSDDSDGPEYNWIDITGEGTRLNPSDDWNSGVLEFGWTFNYYGQEYSALRACSNGWVTLDRSFGGNTISLPRPVNSGSPNALFLINNYDLNPAAGGSMYFWTNEEDQAVLSWINIPKYRYDNVRSTFQIVFDASGMITYNYGAQANVNGSESNIGYESPNGGLGASIVYYEANRIQDEFSIGIGTDVMWRQWLSWTPRDGVIEPDYNQNITVNLNAGDLGAGDYSAILHFLSNDPVTEDVEINVSMNIEAFRDITVEQEELDFGEVVVGQFEDLPVTITNTGNVDLTISDISVEGDYFSVDFDGAFDMARSTDEDVIVTFEPDGAGDYQGALTVTSNDPDEAEITINLFASSRFPIPNMVVSTDSLNFEMTYVGQSSELTFTIASDGEDDLTVSDILIDGEFLTVDFEEQLSLAPDEAREFTVTFEPDDEVALVGTITIESDDPDYAEGFVIQVRGESINPPVIDIDPRSIETTLNFRAEERHTIALANEGGHELIWESELSIISEAIEGRNWIGWSPHNGEIQPEDNMDLVITLNAVNLIAGDYSANLHITSNDPINDDRVIQILMHVGRVPDISLAVDELDFGSVDVGQEEQLALRIYNEGDGNLIVSDLIISGDNFTADFSWAIVVAAEDSEDVTITYSPHDRRHVEDTLRVVSNDPDDGELIVMLTGTGIGPALATNPEAPDFGEVFVGETGEIAFEIHNEGNRQLTITDISVEGDYLDIDFEGGFNVEADEQHDLTLTFAPERPFELEGLITIESNDLAYEDGFEVVVSGIGVASPDITVNPESIDAVLAFEERDEFIVTIGNEGGSNLIWTTEFDVVSEPDRDAYARQLRSVGKPARRIIEAPDAVMISDVKSGNASAFDMIQWNSFISRLENEALHPRRDRRGAPDDMGYYWIDSDEYGDPEYNWVDITGAGDQLNPGNDWNSGQMRLRWNFPWYGDDYDIIRICSNGWITFDLNYEGTATILPQPPNAGEPNSVLLVNNYDLNPSAGGSMYFWTNEEDSAIVSWIDVPKHNNNNARSTFQAILTRNGFVKFQYAAQQNVDGSYSNIGYESGDGAHGSSIIYREEHRIHEGLAVLIVPGGEWADRWVTLNPSGGVVTADTEQEMEVRLNAANLEEGEYTADLHILSNDLDDDDIIVTITLEVGNVPDIAVDPEEMDFGEVEVDDEEGVVEMALTISNVGDVDLNIYDVYIAENEEEYTVDFEDQFVIHADQSEEIAVTFNPEHIADRSGSLIIQSDDPNEEEIAVGLIGIGLGEGWVVHDDDEPQTSTTDRRNYYSRSSFTSAGTFELQGVRVMPFNPSNSAAPCWIFVFTEDEAHNLDEQIWAMRRNSVPAWNDQEEEFEQNWIEYDIPEGSWHRFRPGDSFSIIYGPAPGGEYSENNGSGWWNLYDADVETNRSFVSSNLTYDHRIWEEGTLQGDLFIRAYGSYTLTIPNRSPEWVDIPESIAGNDGDLIEFTFEGSDPDDEQFTELSISYYSANIPSYAVDFNDNGDGTGDFSWQTSYNDIGTYTALFTLTDGEYDAVSEVEITISDINHQPEWSNIEDQYTTNEGQILTFYVSAGDFDRDRLYLSYESEDLPDHAVFVDLGQGRGRFIWQTGFDDGGSYHATFIASDRRLTVEKDVEIVVNEVNRPPVWIAVPQANMVVGYVDQEVSFDLRAVDPEGGNVQVQWSYINPPANPETNVTIENGAVEFVMEPTRGQHGQYNILFTASDGQNNSAITLSVNVKPDHYMFTTTGRQHTLRFNRIFCFGAELVENDGTVVLGDNELDNLGVFTPDELIAGSFVFLNDNDRALMTVYGDEQFTQEVEGFTHGQPFGFLYWDYDAGQEYPVRAEIRAGSTRWRWNGFSIVDLFIGPGVEADEIAHDYGEFFVGQGTEWDVTISSIGSQMVEYLTLSTSDAEVFALPENLQPFNLDVGEERTITVTFQPDRTGSFEGRLLGYSGTMDTLVVELNGTGIQLQHFSDFDITTKRHRIEVVRATYRDTTLTEGDEVGVFADEGTLLAGAGVVNADGAVVISAWGNDGVGDGFETQEEFCFRLWDESADVDTAAFGTFLGGQQRWRENGSSVVSLTSGGSHFNWIASAEADTHSLTVDRFDLRGIGDNANIYLQPGDEVAVVTPLGVVAGGYRVGEDNEDSYTLNAYGDNPQTNNAVEGYRNRDEIYFRIWRAADQAEYLARPTWTEGPDIWRANQESELRLTVVNSNRSPDWRPLERVDANEGTTLRFDVVATDPNRDRVSIRLVAWDLPEAVQFTRPSVGAGHIEWQTTYNDAGQYSATFEAYDGWETRNLTVPIYIRNVNRAPTLAEIGDLEVNEGQVLSQMLQLAVAEPDGDRVIFTASNLPYGARLENNIFYWVPNLDQAGEYNVTFRVTDAGQPPISDQETVTITVNDTNYPPVFSQIAPITVLEGRRVRFTIQVSDRDIMAGGGELELSVEDLPQGAEFNSETGIFNWTTNRSSAGEYEVVFTASDGELEGEMVVVIIVENANSAPRWDGIDNQVIMAGETLRLRVVARDSDPGEQQQLELTATNLPPNCTFTDSSNGIGGILWRPTFADRGVYPIVTFIAEDPYASRAIRRVSFTARVEDTDAPLITNLLPANNAVINSNTPTISARITDERSEIASIVFSVDNSARGDFRYDHNTDEFSWRPNRNMSEGLHTYLIRAVDSYGNARIATARFTINSSAGVITARDLPEYTLRQTINILGTSEPNLHVELWREDELMGEVQASGAGNWRFDNVQLNEMQNNFTIMGYDDYDNVASQDWVSTYVDLDPPEIEFITPEVYCNTSTPEINIEINDIGVGINEGDVPNARPAVQMAIDDDAIVDYEIENGLLTYEVVEALSEGEHILSLSAVDLLGNAHAEPIQMVFFVDTEVPSAIHDWIAQEVDSVGHRDHELIIPVADPRPSSGINAESIHLIIDDQEYDFDWDEQAGSVYRMFDADELAIDMHEVVFTVEDNAGNRIEARGNVSIGDWDDIDPPFFENLSPPPGSVAGRGGIGGGGERMPAEDVSGDTISFVVGDNDAGVNWESVYLQIIALHNLDNPNDNDTTIVEWADLIMNRRSGHVQMPIPQRDPGVELMPGEMPGLEEGFNDVNIFANDEDDNGGNEQWQFFYDEHEPDPPELDDPESEFVNEEEITVTGSTAGDSPDYPDDVDDTPTVSIYRNDEKVSEIEAEYDADFEVNNVILVEGENVIEATVSDAGGNESDFSEPIVIFLDLSEPEIEDFEAANGPHLAIGTPEFTAILHDAGSGIDPDNLVIVIDELEIPGEFDEESETMTATVGEEDALETGDYTAMLIIHDYAGNADTSEYNFDIDLGEVEPPVITQFARYTCLNKVSLTGEGVVGTTVILILNDEEVTELELEDLAEFQFEYTADELPDTSQVQLIAMNPAGTRSELTDAEDLIVDNDPPVFDHVNPENSEVVPVTVEEWRVLVNDLISGVETDSLKLWLRDEEFDFELTETDSGYWLVADLSEVEFDENEAVEVSVESYDNSTPPNHQQNSWEFITNVNYEPEIALPDTSFNEDEQLTLDLHDFITDEDNSYDELEIAEQLLIGADNADLTYDEDEGFLHLEADAEWFGALRMAVSATDPSELSDSDTSDVQVTAVNDAPYFVVNPDDETIFAGVLFEMQLEAEDIDAGDTLIYGDNTDLFQVGADGSVSFTPSEEELGMHVIMLYVFDRVGASDTTMFRLYVELENSPVEVSEEIDDIEIDEDSDPIEIANLNDVFSDADGEDLHFLIEYNSDGILIEIDEDTNIATLTPDPDFNGEVEVTITADDDDKSEASTVFIVDVISVNDPPRQVGLLPYYVIVTENEGREEIAGLDTVFTDIDEGEIEFAFSGGEHLGVDIDGDFVLSITPDEDWVGEESFLLTIEDGIEGQRAPQREFNNNDVAYLFFEGVNHGPRRDESSEVEITVDVRHVNHAPELLVNDPFEVTMQEDQDPLVIETPIAELFTDPDLDYGDELEVMWDDIDGPIELSLDDDEEYIIATLVEENFNGDYDYAITCTDLEGAQVALTLAFTVTPVNDPPEVVEDIQNVEVDEDEEPRLVEVVDLDNIFFDVDGDELVYGIAEAPDELNMGVDEDNVLYFSADDNYNSAEGITVTVFADDQHDGRMMVSFHTLNQSDIDDPGLDSGPVRQLRSLNAKKSSDDSNSISLNNNSSNAIRTDRAVRQLRGMKTPVETSMSLFNNTRLSRTLVRRDDTADAEFQLVINPVNDEPYWDEVDDIEIDETEAIEATVTAHDIDLDFEGDDLTIRIIDDDGLAARGAQFSDTGDGSGVFTWQTGYEDAGEYHPVIQVYDIDEASAEMSVTIIVNNVNRAPVWDAEMPDTYNGHENELLEFTVEGSDPDGEEVSLSAASENLPEGWEFADNDNNTGTFSWTPGYDDSGEYLLTLTVSDQEYDVDAEVTIVIEHVNRPPVWDEEMTDSYRIDEAQTLEFTVEGSDPDGDAVSLAAASDDMPAAWEFVDNEDNTGTFTWTPGYEDSGDYSLTLTISDAEYDVETEVTINAIHVNRPPVWDEELVESYEVDEDMQLQFTVQGSDPDGDDLTLSASSEDLPEGWEFADNDDNSGAFTWTPTYDDSGDYTLTVIISDEEFDIETDVTINVIHVNRTPVWDDYPENVEIYEDQTLEFTIEGSDPDGDALTVTAESVDLPEGWEFTDNEDGTGSFIWQPSYDDAGEYGLTILVADAEFEVEAEINILVVNVNRAPVVISAIEDVEIDEDSGVYEVVDLDQVFEDPDGDALTFEIVEGIEALNLVIDAETNILTLEPGLNYNGESDVVIAADDGYEQALLSGAVRFKRSIGGSVNSTFERNLRWSGNSNAITPPNRDAVGEEEFTVTVHPVNDEPFWDEYPSAATFIGVITDLITFEIEAEDVDTGDELTIVMTDAGGLPEVVEFVDNEDGSATFTWQTTDEDEGEYYPIFVVSDAEYSDELEFTVIVAGERDQEITLNTNWNLISLNVSPGARFYVEGEERGADVRLMMQTLINDDEELLMTMMKSEDGSFCSPAWDWWGIDFWNLQEGYWIAMSADWDAVWTGAPIPADTPLDIAEGWNIIPYYPTYELDASADGDFYVISPIIDYVVIVKDVHGNFIIPAEEFSNMEDWTPGQGYQIYVEDDIVFTYPEEQNEGGLYTTGNRGDVESHWTTPICTGENMSVLIKSFDGLSRDDAIRISDGDQVAAFDLDSGHLAGVGTVRDETCGFAIWGDDSRTEAKDGLIIDDEFCLVVYDVESGIEIDLTPGVYHRGTGLKYSKDGIVILDAVVSPQIPDEYYLLQNYPNPFNATTQIRFGLPERSDVRLSVYTASGRLVDTVIAGELPAGQHKVTWSAADLSTGVYIFVLQAGDTKLITKSVLLR